MHMFMLLVRNREELAARLSGRLRKHRFGDAFFILAGEVAGFYKLVANFNFTEGYKFWGGEGLR